MALDMPDVHNVYANYVKTLTRDVIYKNKDIENINCGILDTAGNFDNMADANNMAANLGWQKSSALFSASQNQLIVDKCNSTFLNDGNSYLPSIHEFKFKLVRACNHVIFTIDKCGGGNSNFDALTNNNSNTLNAAVDDWISKFLILNFYWNMWNPMKW